MGSGIHVHGGIRHPGCFGHLHRAALVWRLDLERRSAATCSRDADRRAMIAKDIESVRPEKLVYRTTVLGQQEFIYEIVHDTESDFAQESYVAKISFSALFARRQCQLSAPHHGGTLGATHLDIVHRHRRSAYRRSCRGDRAGYSRLPSHPSSILHKIAGRSECRCCRETMKQRTLTSTST
jgi:hypothetical protein